MLLQVSIKERELQTITRELQESVQQNDMQFAKMTAELLAAKREIERLMNELRKLLDQKLALEINIEQYQTMLELGNTEKYD